MHDALLVSGSAVTAVAAKSSPQLETLEESLSHPELLQCVSARDYPRCAQGSGRSSLNQAANHCTRQHGGYTAPGSFHVSMVNNRLPVPTFLATLSQSSNQCTLHPDGERRPARQQVSQFVRTELPIFHLACACVQLLETESHSLWNAGKVE